MIAHWTPILVAFVLAACCPASDPLPDLAVRWSPAPPTITPVPAPDLICLAHMDARSGRSEPKSVMHTVPRFPKRKVRTRVTNPTWFGVVEIDADGSVARVRTIRPLKVDPPWPELDASVVDAIRQWTYEPTCLNGHPVKNELHVTVHIEFR